jgi:hypothetical protein
MRQTLLLLLLLFAGPARAAAPELIILPVDLPQARIDAIDASQWPKLRVFATVLDATGRPVPPKALKKLAIVDAKKPSAPPLVLFRQGKPDEAQKDAKLQTRDKAAVPLAAMVVVAGYQHEALRAGTLGPRVKDALTAGWKQFVAGDRVNALWYGDRLYRAHALKGHMGALDDVETRQEQCQTALAEARAGVELSLSAGDAADKDNPLPPPGTWLCGLQDDAKRVGLQVKAATFKGHFPRLFALGAPFYDVKRYCAPPPEELEGFGPFEARNVSRQADARDRDAAAGKPEPFATSAFDEAIATLLTDARPGEESVLLLVSDGRDGYFRELELCEAHPPRACQGVTDKAALKTCIGAFLDQRIATSQLEFKARATHWLGLLRAAGIRVFAVGLGAIGRDFELDRLRLLAERSGGTYRLAATEDDVGQEVLATMAELSGQIVIDFQQVQDDGADRPTLLNLALDVEVDPAQARVKVRTQEGGTGDARPKFRSAVRQTAVLPELTKRQVLERALRNKIAGLQDFLGYRTYLVLCWVLAVVGCIMALGLVGLIVLKLIRRIRKPAAQGG